MTTAIVSAFNNIGTQFVAELVETFPEEPQFKVFKSGVRALIWAKKDTLIQLYAHYCVSFHDQIVNRDEQFFLNENYDNVIDADDKDMVTQIIDKLKIHWGTMNTENKEKVWEYIQTLLKLSDQYCAIKGK